MRDITNFENTKRWPSIGAGFGIGLPLGAVGAYLAINGGVNISNQISTGGAALAVFQGGLLNYLSYEVRKRQSEPLHAGQVTKATLIGTFTGAALLTAIYGADIVLDKAENYLESELSQSTVDTSASILPLKCTPPCP